MHLGNVTRGCGIARADGPNRLIGHNQPFCSHTDGDRALELPGNHRQRLAGRPLAGGFADTDNRHQPGGQRRFRLGPDQCITFTVVGAPLGVAEDDVTAAQIAQHRAGSITGVRARGRRVAVLSANMNAGAPKNLRHQRDMKKRRANQQLAGGTRGLAACLEVFGQGPGVSRQAIHFPIAGN